MTATARFGRHVPLRVRMPAALICARLALGLAVAGPAPSSADIAGKLFACRHVKADVARLQCFDRLAASLRATSAEDSASGESKAVRIDPKQDFGLSSSEILAREFKVDAKRDSVASITVRVAGLQAAADGRTVYRLDNGQVWEELENDGEAPPVKVGEQIQISRGWMGSYWMQTTSGRGCKVYRLH